MTSLLPGGVLVVAKIAEVLVGVVFRTVRPEGDTAAPLKSGLVIPVTKHRPGGSVSLGWRHGARKPAIMFVLNLKYIVNIHSFYKQGNKGSYSSNAEEASRSVVTNCSIGGSGSCSAVSWNCAVDERDG